MAFFSLLFHKWSIIGNFMAYQDRFETYLLQLFAHPETSEWLSILVFVYTCNSLFEIQNDINLNMCHAPED